MRRLVKAEKVEGTLPFGPAQLPEADAYMDLPDDCSIATAAGAMRRWYSSARREIAHLTGRDMRFKQHKFAWQSAEGTRSRPWIPSCSSTCSTSLGYGRI